jgi:hypothetical protein
MRVRQIIVDFKKWSTGVTNNSFTVKVRHLGRGNAVSGTNDSYAEETAGTWTEAASYTDTTGQKDRQVFNVGSYGYTGGFQVGITDIIGCAIHNVTAVFYEADGRPTR